MLKCDARTLESMEKLYPGIIHTIMYFENAELPACPHCGSDDVANVQVGIVGRSIHISGATTKFKLIPNGPKPGNYYCNACRLYWGIGQ